MGTGYQPEKKFWVPMGTGTGQKRNFGYRWVPGTGKKKILGYWWVPGTGKIFTYADLKFKLDIYGHIPSFKKYFFLKCSWTFYVNVIYKDGSSLWSIKKTIADALRSLNL